MARPVGESGNRYHRKNNSYRLQQFSRSSDKEPLFYRLFPLPETDSDPDTDMESCTMQNFSTDSDSDSDPLIETW